MTHDDELIRSDEQARADALDVSRSFIVQAPAGSGKTELLIQRYLRLLGAVDDPEEILAITFTRKAAAEMQFRVLQALRRAERGVPAREDYETATVEAATAALARSAERGWRLIEHPGRMRIQTLDSLNASIARMQPMSGSNAITNMVADEAQMRMLYRNAAAATLDYLDESSDLRVAVEEVLLHVDNNTGIYIDYVARMLETRDQWLPFVGHGQLSDESIVELRQQLEANLVRVISQHLGQVRDSIPPAILPEIFDLARYAAANLHDAGLHDEPIAQLLELESLPHDDQAEIVAGPG